MRARLFARGLWIGAGIALLLAVARVGAGVLSWPLAVAGTLLLLAGCVADWGGRRVPILAGLLFAGGVSWFRHLNYAAIAPASPAVVLLIVGAVLALLIAVNAARGPWLGELRRRLSRPATILLLGLWVYGTARWFSRAEWTSRPDEVFRGLYPLLTAPLAGLALIGAARAVPVEAVERCAARLGGLVHSRPRVVVAGLAVLAALVPALLCLRFIGPLPHVEDGIAYLYQAKTMVHTGLYQPSPPAAYAFDARFAWVFMDDAGRSYGIFPPGWPLLLALGVLARLPWLINPLLGAAAVLLLWRLARLEHDRVTTAAVVALLVASPFFALQNASFMSHPATLVWILTAFLGATQLRHGGGFGSALLLGLGIGMTLATRYVEGMLLGLTMLGYLSWATARRRVAARWWLVAALGVLPGLGLALADNQAKTGSPFVTPVEHWYTVEHGAPVNRPGFGPEVGLEWDHSLGPGHTVIEGLWNTNANLFELDRYGFGWACGSLLLALLFVVHGAKSELDRLWLVYSLLLGGIYSAYWYHGIAFGPRFFHPLLIPLALFTVKGIVLLADWLERPVRRVALPVVLASLMAWLVWLPLELLTTYDDYRGRDADEARIVPMARAAAGGRPCVVVLAMENPEPGVLTPDYGIAFSLNPPGFAGDVLVARELDTEARPQRDAIRAAYPERVLLLWYKNGSPSRLEPMPAGVRDAIER